MPNVRIVSDSACDLSEEVANALNIDVVPLSIRFGNEEFVDRKDLSPKEFWRRVAASSILPETAAPSPGAFEMVFRAAAARGNDAVVCIILSSKLSATIGAAQLAATAVANLITVTVVDSLAITMGLGTMVRTAAELAQSGADTATIVAAVESLKPRTRVYGALDTLDNLKKGGRIGGAQALIGSLLSIKPMLDLSSGATEELGKQRTRSKAIAALVDLVSKAKAQHGSIENLAVMHGDAPDIDAIVELFAPYYPREQIVVGQMGAVIGTHAGPRIVGVTFNLPKGS
jgi:DegV family protein with EDD domain